MKNLPQPNKPSLTVQLAAFFQARPHQWISANDLMFAGKFAWRTKVVSDARTQCGMRISNRQRHVRTEGGDVITISEYRFEPEDQSRQSATTDASTSAVAV